MLLWPKSTFLSEPELPAAWCVSSHEFLLVHVDIKVSPNSDLCPPLSIFYTNTGSKHPCFPITCYLKLTQLHGHLFRSVKRCWTHSVSLHCRHESTYFDCTVTLQTTLCPSLFWISNYTTPDPSYLWKPRFPSIYTLHLWQGSFQADAALGREPLTHMMFPKAAPAKIVPAFQASLRKTCKSRLRCHEFRTSFWPCKKNIKHN